MCSLDIAVVQALDAARKGFQDDSKRSSGAHQGNREDEKACPQILQVIHLLRSCTTTSVDCPRK